MQRAAGPSSEWEKAQERTKHTDLEGWGRQGNSLWGLKVCPGTWWDSQPGEFFHLLGSMLVVVPQGIILALGAEWVFPQGEFSSSLLKLDCKMLFDIIGSGIAAEVLL